MTETNKTLTYVAVGLVSLLLGFAPWRGGQPTVSDVQVGQPLFPDFENALSATNLEIREFDETTSTPSTFKVGQVDGVWCIPSKENYPADAKDHLARAATSLINVEILGVAGDNRGEHEVYGVLEPTDDLKEGAVGIGRRVIFTDSAGTTLADLIIGKEVKDQAGVRYVRKEGKDQVYRVAIKTDSLSTKFEDWIEKDLLKLNSFDIREVAVNDYSVRAGITAEGRLGVNEIKSAQMLLKYDDTKPADKDQWTLAESVIFEKNKPKPAPLAEGEMLDATKLNDLRNALDDLKIVDVEKKPEGLSGDLTVSEEVSQNDAKLQSLAQSLIIRGYVPVKSDKEGRLVVLSTDGEVIARLKDGVEYVIRFGQIAGTGPTDAKPEEKKEGKESGSSVNRYVMIAAQVNDTLIPKPTLEPLPEEKPADAKPETTKPEEAKTEGAKAEEPKPDAETLAEKRKQIEKENERKQKDYDDKLKQAQDKVQELNDRFGGWYYVISDEVYRKIHLGRKEIVKAEEKKPGAGNTVEDFKALDEQGLEPPAK